MHKAPSLLIREESGYHVSMARAAPTSEPLNPDAECEPGYAAWKREKVERALAESADREAMIPAAEVWRDLGLER